MHNLHNALDHNYSIYPIWGKFHLVWSQDEKMMAAFHSVDFLRSQTWLYCNEFQIAHFQRLEKLFQYYITYLQEQYIR